MHTKIPITRMHVVMELGRFLLMAFTRREVATPSSASEARPPSDAGQFHHIVAFGSLGFPHSDAGEDAHMEAIASKGIVPSAERHDSLIGTIESLGTSPSRQFIRHLSEVQVASSTLPTTAIVKRRRASWSINFRAFAEQMDTIIKPNSAAQANPSAKAIAEEILRQQQHKK